jgi:hypothetical protein
MRGDLCRRIGVSALHARERVPRLEAYALTRGRARRYANTPIRRYESSIGPLSLVF